MKDLNKLSLLPIVLILLSCSNPAPVEPSHGVKVANDYIKENKAYNVASN